MTKKLCLLCSILLEPYIIWLSFVVHKFKMMESPGFSLFFQNFDFWVVRRVKVQKMAKMTKNCPLCLISQEPYIIWSWFLVHMCRMMTSQDPFFNFSKFWFCRLLGGKRAKKAQPHTVSQEPYLVWLWFLVIYFFVK